MSKQIINIPDCTNKCQSTQHGDVLTAAITKRCVSDSDLCSYFINTCCCCESVKDPDGRIALHVAASCGRTDLVRWLVENRHANINIRDRESGYTALHRSIFYGKIYTAVELIKLGANITLQDANGLTYLEHAMFDRFRPPDTSFTSGELYTWGTNSNNSLGSQLPRLVPESMDIFHKEYPNENVQNILINQFHSVILSESGTAYSCGHGQGGRLGLGIQHTEVVPKPIKFPAPLNMPHTSERIQIISCSIARDHSLFLASNGELYSCGLNRHRVLGIAPPPPELLVPRALKYVAADASLVATGNYHSLVWNKSGLFTWGLNAGQLGHQLNNAADEKYIFTPKRVKCINCKENIIKFVCASTGATVVYTEKGDVYVLHEYQCRKIASRQLNLIHMAVIGGKLNHTLDPELSNKNRELKVAALTNTGSLLVWQETDPVLRRCLFSVSRALNVKQIALNVNSVLFTTRDGEAFKGEIKPRKKKTITVEKDKSTKSDFHKFLEKDECIMVKVEKIPRIHRAISIQSDPKGQNFGVVQDRPYKLFTRYDVSESTMLENMYDLLSSADACDDITDVDFDVGGRLFSAHKYVLASRSHYFANLFAKNKGRLIELKGFHSIIFEEFLKYVYTGSTELIEIGELKSHSLMSLCSKPLQDKKENIIDEDSSIIDEDESAFLHYSKNKSAKEKPNSDRKLDNPVRMLHEMAKRLEIIDLLKILGNLDMTNHVVKVKKNGREIRKLPLIFNKNLCPELYDVEIHCRDDRILKAHKCILAARLDYFGSMFSSRWRGNETSKVSMPFSKGVVDALLEFLYTDSLDKLEERDVDQLFKIIILADQFFVTRLKDQCENILSDLLTIKNAIQLLTFADAYNAENLKENCFEFIQQNMTSFLEMRLLDELQSDLLNELSEFYQIKRGLGCRVITPYSTAVSDEEIVQISSMYPVDISVKKEKGSKEKSKVATTRKRTRPHKVSSSEKLLSRSLEDEFSLLNVSFSSDIPEIDVSIDRNADTRVRAILIANDIGRHEKIEENYTPLHNKSDNDSLSSSFVDTLEFPLLNSPPKQSGFHSRTPHKSETRPKPTKLSQKQRKRLSSENSGQVVDSPTLTESPKNPWKIIQEPVSPDNTPQNDNMITIISNEKKQKENLVKITSKLLVFTQMEDRAIDELKKFYSVDAIEDEVIIIERVSLGAVALPVWVPKTK